MINQLCFYTFRLTCKHHERQYFFSKKTSTFLSGTLVLQWERNWTCFIICFSFWLGFIFTKSSQTLDSIVYIFDLSESWGIWTQALLCEKISTNTTRETRGATMLLILTVISCNLGYVKHHKIRLLWSDQLILKSHVNSSSLILIGVYKVILELPGDITLSAHKALRHSKTDC